MGASKKLRIDLDVLHVGANGLTDPTCEFLSAFGIDPTGTVLVRPDGFVAWRAKTGEGASTAKMESVLSTILSR
jgi:putative polyketide hydroxylase